MIPFFRKIRKKMADDNKPLKYARYAIGEIVLVVIGILIALQINNWNEAKKNYQIEQDFFRDVLDDFQKDRSEMVNNIEFFENRIEQLRWLLYKVRHPKEDLYIFEFREHIEPLYYDMPPISYSSAFEAAKSSGTFEKIKNKDILKTLTQYYTEFSEIDALLKSTLRIIEGQLEPIMGRIPQSSIQLSSSKKVVSINQYDNTSFYQLLEEIGDERDISIDLKSFIQKPEFESYLTGDLGRSFNSIHNIKSRLELLKNIEKSIESYLYDPSLHINPE
jgi:hypothetical protein